MAVQSLPGHYRSGHLLPRASANVKGRHPCARSLQRLLATRTAPGKYDALVQRGEMTVYRDNNSDAHIDTDTPTESGYFGINRYRANKHTTSKHVGKWSAGCQVLASPEHFSQFMNLCRDSASLYGEFFLHPLTESDALRKKSLS